MNEIAWLYIPNLFVLRHYENKAGHHQPRAGAVMRFRQLFNKTFSSVTNCLMDGRTDEWADGPMDQPTDGHTNCQTDRWTHQQSDLWNYEYMNKNDESFSV